jgi:uncharacterized protein
MVQAADSPPSEASIQQLLEVMQVHKSIDSTLVQLDAFTKSTMQQATQGHSVTPKLQADMDKRHDEMMAMIKETLEWSKLEPMYVRIYQKSLTQKDVDGMIAFYKTSAGEAVITKVPVIMQNTLAEMQQIMKPMMEKLQHNQQEVAEEVKADGEKKGG